MMQTIDPLFFSEPVRDYSEGPNRSLGKNEFLKLLMVQLQNQNPLNVQEDKDFIAQMAQFSTLEQTTNLSSSLQGMLGSQQLSQGSLLLDRQIEATLTDSKGDKKTITGKVTEARLVDGEVKLLVGEELVSLKDVVKVK